MATDAHMDAHLQAKAEQKRDFVQNLLQCLERAMEKNGEQDREYLKSIIEPGNPCFSTLIKLLVEPKYKSFIRLRCVVLRSIQLIMRIAILTVAGADHNVGFTCLLELAGEDLAGAVWPEIALMAEQNEEPLAACNALEVLAELGPEALTPELVPRILDLFLRLPDRVDHLAEIALRVHAWGGAVRQSLLNLSDHEGAKHLCEVLLQMINRADKNRRLRACKVLAGFLSMPNSDCILYTNDVRVLVEILLREMPNDAYDASAFMCQADCFKALALRSEAARKHRKEEVLQVLEDLRADERNDASVRAKCAEVLRVLAAYAGA